MTNIHGCLNFNCLPTKVNLIFIAIIDASSIIINSFRMKDEEFKSKIYDKYPILEIINIFLDTISLVLCIFSILTTKCMNRKKINKTLTSISAILEYVKIIFSFVNIFIIIKGFINFDNNYFLYDPAFNNNYDAYPKDQRIEGLKKIKFAPFEYYEERIIHHTVYSGDYEEIKSTIIITDESKFYYFNYSKKYINFKKEKSTIPIFEDDNFGDLLLYLLAEILEMLGALNWGSVGTKVEKLIDEKIETRLEDYGEEKDCIANFILTMRGKKFIGFSIIVFIIDFVYLGLLSLLNQEWLENEIVYFSFYLDLIDLVFFLCI